VEYDLVMANIMTARKAVITRVLDGEGRTPRDQRRAAFANKDVPEPVRELIDKVAKRAHTIVDADIAAAKAAGLTEDQLFELIIAAAIGQASRQYDGALAALAAATKE
jgi:alkylhydroperoxidase family enzyme